MSTRTDKLKPGDMVRPTWDDRYRSTAPSPVTLTKRPAMARSVSFNINDGPSEANKVDIADLFEPNVATLKWTETGLVLARHDDEVMVLFGQRFGWAKADKFETLPGDG